MEAHLHFKPVEFVEGWMGKGVGRRGGGDVRVHITTNDKDFITTYAAANCT